VPVEVRRQFGAVAGDGELRRSGGAAQQFPEDSQGGITDSHDHIRCCGGRLAGKVLVDPLKVRQERTDRGERARMTTS
jgi:hypothetical protein